MENFIQWMEKHFVPVAARIGQNKYLSAIKDAFVIVMPLIILGAMAVLINYVQFSTDIATCPYQSFMRNIFGENWQSLGGFISSSSMGMLSILITITVASRIARYNGIDEVQAGVIALSSLVAITYAENGGIPANWAGALGLFVAIFVAILSAELFTLLLKNEKLQIKMPEGVPPGVVKSFASLIPIFITILAFGLLRVGLIAVGITDIHQFIYDTIQGPLRSMTSNPITAVLFAFFNALLWSFGLHGGNIIYPLRATLFMESTTANIEAFQTGQPIEYILTMPFFDNFVYMGGAGATLCLVIAVLAFSKRKDYKMVGKLAFTPCVFNINEPLMFGLPVVLNPLLIIPFIITPVVLALTTYGAMASGIVPKTIAMVPWTTPPVISGYLATGSIMGAVLQIVNLALGLMIYTPFIVLANRYSTDKADETNTVEKAV